MFGSPFSWPFGLLGFPLPLTGIDTWIKIRFIFLQKETDNKYVIDML